MGSRHSRLAVTEITGTLLMIAVTLVAGAAVIGWVNGQAASSENVLGQNAANQANYFKESFVVVSVQFSNNAPNFCQATGGQTYCNQVSIAIYNNGGIGLTIQSVTFANTTSKSASGARVPTMSVALSLPTPTSASYTMTYTCGSTKGTTTAAAPTQPVAQASVPPTLYTFTLPPLCPITSGILDGASYSLQVLGLYGNLVSTQVTANG